MPSTAENVDELMKQYGELTRIPNNRVKCQLSGHEMTCTEDAIRSYVNGSKFKRLKALHNLIAEYKDYFDEAGPSKLFCKVTNRMVAKEGSEIERHVNGARFKKNLEKYLSNVNNDSAKENTKQEDDMDVDKATGSKVTRSRHHHVTTMTSSSGPVITVMEEEEHLSDESSSISAESGEQSDMEQFYPELENSDSADSDFDWTAMDTDMEAGVVQKRKFNNRKTASTDSKKRKD